MGMICVGAAAMVYAESGSAKWIAMAMVGLIWGVEVGEFLRKLVRERRKWPA